MTDLLIDANALYATAWYGTGQDPYETFQRSVKDALTLFSPDLIKEPVDRTLFCWDGGQKRPKGRTQRPPEYESTKPAVKNALEALTGTRNVRLEGYEADDVIATAAFASPADHVVVVSSDKDLQQLQGGAISYYDLRHHGFLSTREILSRWHVKRTSQVALALAVQGDSTDKIPGIKGWGPKKVEKLFEAVKSNMPFDQALNTIDEQIPEEKKHEFYEALELTLLNTNVPNVPEPLPVMFNRDIKALIRLGLDECIPMYRRLLSKY